MAAGFTPFIIFQRDGDKIVWPKFDATLGQATITYFTDKDKARQFLRHKRLGPDWEIGQMTVPEFVRWLRQNLMDGTPFAVADPGPGMGKPV